MFTLALLVLEKKVRLGAAVTVLGATINVSKAAKAVQVRIILVKDTHLSLRRSPPFLKKWQIGLE